VKTGLDEKEMKKGWYGLQSKNRRAVRTAIKSNKEEHNSSIRGGKEMVKRAQ